MHFEVTVELQNSSFILITHPFFSPPDLTSSSCVIYFSLPLRLSTVSIHGRRYNPHLEVGKTYQNKSPD